MSRKLYADLQTSGVIKFSKSVSGNTDVNIKTDSFNITETRIN